MQRHSQQRFWQSEFQISSVLNIHMKRFQLSVPLVHVRIPQLRIALWGVILHSMCYCYFKQEQLALKPTLHLTQVFFILFALSWCHSLVEPSQWLCVEFIEDGWSKFHGGKNLLATVCAREFWPVLNELDKTRLGNWKWSESGDNWAKISPSCYPLTKSRLHSPDVGRGEIIAQGLTFSK